MIAIIDYGLGNIRAFSNVFKGLNIPAFVAKESSQLVLADKLILPGVGSFDYAMQRLNNSGMRDTLDELVLRKRIPVLGICVGMQMLANSSAEGVLPGLGWIDATVERFPQVKFRHNAGIPHMGWNTIHASVDNNILTDLDFDAKFYFLHSYFFKCNNSEDSIASTDYYGKFTSIVRHDNIFGFQFHPEKSHKWGVKLIQNFSKL